MAVTTRIVLQEGMRFEAVTNSGERLILDAAPGVGGSGGGPVPKELLPVALAGCTGMDVISILRKMQQDVSGLEVLVEADTAPEHPKRYVSWKVIFHVTGKDLDPTKIERAIALSRDRYCGVSTSFDPSTPRAYYYTINGSAPSEVGQSEESSA